MNTEELVLDFCEKYMPHCMVDYKSLIPCMQRWDVRVDNDACSCRGWRGSTVAFDFRVDFEKKTV